MFVSCVLTDSTTYYVGIVDSDYNAGRPRKGEVQSRDYGLRLWWSQCLYWQDTQQQWATDGCSVQSTSSYHTAHCRLVSTRLFHQVFAPAL